VAWGCGVGYISKKGREGVMAGKYDEERGWGWGL
jgi:hypothetical protein